MPDDDRTGSDNADPDGSGRWRSPLRGPWLTSVFGLILLFGIPVEFLTGLLSYDAYNPQLTANDVNPAHGLLGFVRFNWLTGPPWFYRLIEGVHVMLGLALVPVLLAKLWSVMPRLFVWPAARTVAEFLERLSVALLVGGVVFEFSTGILDIDYLNAYHFNFITGHFFGAWLFMAGFVIHVALKFAPMVRALRSRRLRTELRTDLASTRPEEADGGLVAEHPARATMSRRGALALVGGTTAAVIAVTAPETISDKLRRLALLGVRDRSPGTGANHFPVNHTAAQRGIGAAMVGVGWRLEVAGNQSATMSRGQLLSMPLRTAVLPIACTDGWSTTQHWTGVPLARLAQLAGVARVSYAVIESLDGTSVSLSGTQVHARQSMLALKVNHADLSLDHGYPARVMVPAAPGTHNLKWVRRITFIGST